MSKTSSAYKLIFDDPGSAPDRTAFPEADAVVLRDHSRLVIHPDGRTTLSVRRAVKMLTEWGRDRLSDEHIVFNARFQDLKILANVTFAADGERKEAPEVNRVVMTPSALERAPWWADFQEMVVTNIGTEKNAIKVLEYEITDKEPWRDILWGREIFGEPYPVMEKVFSLEVPKGRTVKYSVSGGAAKPEKSKGKAGEVLTWRAAELPEFAQEDQPLSSWYLLPRVTWTAVESWKDLGAILGPRLAAASAADKKVSEWAKKTVEGISSEDQKALKLHLEIQSAVRKIEWPVPAGGFLSRTAAEVFESRYGNALEAAVLLASALSAVQIPSAILLAADARIAESEIAFLGPETGAWVQAGSAGLMLNAARSATECGPYSMEGRTFRKVSGRNLEAFVPAARTASAEVKCSVTLGPDLAATGKARLLLRGRFNPYLAVQTSDEPEAAKKQAEALPGKVFPKASMEKFDVAAMDLELADLKIEFKAPAAKEAVQDVHILEIPPVTKGFAGLDLSLHRTCRTTLFELKGPFAVTASIEMTIPAGFEAKAIPADIDSKAGAFSLKRSFKKEGKTVRIEERIEASARYLEPGDYASFRDLALSLENPVKNRIVLFKV